MAQIKIKPSKVGTLRAIARREGAINDEGKISVSWMRKKMSSPRTSAAVKKKLNFALNARKWK
ncbi:hypothetical protein pVco7_gp001 [Vibrio phage pVco-7]|uniref:Uncharacterized protein n=1 Tax=Vibrio phage pVco-5 TaxID=1965485 RepID=A0A1W6JUQ9_9CAUD|nr:hypothetical protein KNT61_gp002 [Vibrio phage pVco-5]ARM70990.1 hypothetical protein pVco5_002 [Vibrio phage pVco-5]